MAEWHDDQAKRKKADNLDDTRLQCGTAPTLKRKHTHTQRQSLSSGKSKCATLQRWRLEKRFWVCLHSFASIGSDDDDDDGGDYFIMQNSTVSFQRRCRSRENTKCGKSSTIDIFHDELNDRY